MFDAFTKAYLMCALWTGSDGDDDTPLKNNFDIEDIALSSITQACEECRAFQEENEWALSASGLDVEQQAYDFWLTRNGHGAGYWDRGIGEIGEQLTSAAHAWGESNLYVGDDGRLYLS